MPLIRFEFTKPQTAGVDAPATGLLRLRLINRQPITGKIRTTEPFPVYLVDGVANVELSVTPAGYGWEVAQYIDGEEPVTEVVIVDADSENFSDLQRVSARSLKPSAGNVDAWVAALNSLRRGLRNGVAAINSSGYVIDAAGNILLDKATADGSYVQPAALVTKLDKATADAKYTTGRVHVFSCDGQSNMSGRGPVFGSFSDPVHPRIKQFPGRGASAGMVIDASEPLIMHDVATGMGPALQFARNLIATLPPEDVIILVPNAHGGTMLPTDAALGWRWGVPGNLSAQAVANTDAALAAAAIAYPNAKVTLDGILWLEGETAGTNSIPAATYQTDFDALAAGYRQHYGIPNLPIILGGMVPEGLSVGTRSAINVVHSDIPYRVPFTGWTPGVAGKQNGDQLHYASDGQVIVARGMFNEYQRVRAGLRPVYPSLVVPPVVVPAPGATLVVDSFNRADVAEVTTTDTAGKSWVRELLTNSTARFGISSNEGAPIYTTTGGSAFYVLDCGVTAIQLHAEVTVINSSFRLVLWYQDTANYVALVMTSATSVELRKVVAGVSTTLNTFTVASSTSKTLDVIAKSTTDVSVWIDGVSVLSSGPVAGVTPTSKVGVQITSTSTVGAARLNLIRASAIA